MWKLIIDRFYDLKNTYVLKEKLLYGYSRMRIYSSDKLWLSIDYLLHIVVELDLLLAQASDKLLGSDSAHLPLLGDYAVEEVSQTGQ